MEERSRASSEQVVWQPGLHFASQFVTLLPNSIFNMIRFSIGYFKWVVVLLIAEIIIALYVRDSIVRPYVGDFLVVILMYCFIKSFLNTPVIPTALSVLALSFIIETLQYFNIAEKMGYQDSRVAKTLLGYSFEWLDLVAYSLGIVTVIGIEKLRGNQK